MSSNRLLAIDWLRGVAVVLMFQTHAYDSWLAPEARAGAFYTWSRLLGGYPAPLFLFLAGVSLALLASARHRAGRGPRAILHELATRALEVAGYAVVFRLAMYVAGGFRSPGDLLRVDVLNVIAVAMALCAPPLACARPRRRVVASLGLALVLALLTPLAWDAWRPSGWPDAIVGYWSGRVPGAFFPIFPWAGFTALGAAVGTALAAFPGRESRVAAASAAAGAVLIPLALALDRLPQVYPVYDFWWTSPSYFLVKCGILLLALGGAFAWAPWASPPSPLRQMGRTSLPLYWAHIEIAYGGLVAPSLRKSLDVSQASVALLVLCVAMLALSVLRERVHLLRAASAR
ncbi:MAG: DUF1624 domain-containing protein [Vicinamibacteria bacterium]|jgi:uncharacterized membrane protein|nr:DUF1624 domain-containing protein [Vicinamibacteria bacterium]